MTKTDKLDKDTLGIVIEKLKEIELKKRAESEEMRGYLLVREATDKVKQVGNPKYIHRFKNMTHDQKYLEYNCLRDALLKTPLNYRYCLL